jgi:hypothetical protein
MGSCTNGTALSGDAVVRAVEEFLKDAPVGGEILVWFWSAFDRSRFSSSWARNDESLDEPLAHQKHATDQEAGPVLQSVEAAPELSDDIERSLEADFSDQDGSALRRFDLEHLDQV